MKSSQERHAVEWPVGLSPAASIDAPLQDEGPWIVAINGVPKARVSADVAAVLNAVDGEKTPAQVALHLGKPWTAADVLGIVRQLAHTRIFDDGARLGEESRVQFRAPLTIQFTLFNPSPFLQSLRPAVAALARPATLAPLVLLLLGGLVGAVLAGPNIGRVLASPLPVEAYLFVLGAMFVSTLLHELGHGMALSYFGGTPRRIGIMLFYLSPAFFCDVTDGWRLGSRKQRVIVALAGPLVHVGLGSIAMATQGLLPDSSMKDAAVLYGVICYAVAILNLFPFIKLDGYVALMSAVDIPHLRKKSLDSLADVVGSGLLGSRRSVRSPRPLPWFGLASFAAGIGFMLLGYQRLVPIFLQFGLVGHAVVLMILCLLVFVAVRATVRFFRSAATNGSPAWRRGLVILFGALALAALLSAIPVKAVTVAGFTHINGELHVVVPLQGADDPLRPGDQVTLQSQGMIIHQNLGRATIRDQPPSTSLAPLAAVLPIALEENNLPVVAYAATGEGGPNLPPAGRAEVVGQRQTSLGEWLWNTATNSPLWPPQSGQTTDSTKGHP
ncbi:daptide biosynthesis intramembrane metalloprotease [Paenarthrobacter sp. NPDC089322]|uniref:daptide biosynthesis intramembrane metalloprotease n=1 Tax=Paenarthrobacter sp. NPDC089322 TaxID=3155065 RepID=UPI00341EE67D